VKATLILSWQARFLLAVVWHTLRGAGAD
jgi:hypothetical protein